MIRGGDGYCVVVCSCIGMGGSVLFVYVGGVCFGKEV